MKSNEKHGETAESLLRHAEALLMIEDTDTYKQLWRHNLESKEEFKQKKGVGMTKFYDKFSK